MAWTENKLINYTKEALNSYMNKLRGRGLHVVYSCVLIEGSDIYQLLLIPWKILFLAEVIAALVKGNCLSVIILHAQFSIACPENQTRKCIFYYSF